MSATSESSPARREALRAAGPGRAGGAASGGAGGWVPPSVCGPFLPGQGRLRRRCAAGLRPALDSGDLDGPRRPKPGAGSRGRLHRPPAGPTHQQLRDRAS